MEGGPGQWPLAMRVVLLFAINWVIGLTAPLFSVFNHSVSGRDLILLGGGAFLLGKAVIEIHEQLYPGSRHDGRAKRTAATFKGVLGQIALLDVVFSLDSVITAVGMADRIGVMIAAVLIAVGVMMWLSSPVMRIVNEHPTIRMLALAFLLLIGGFSGRRGRRRPPPQGLHLLRDGVRRAGRNAEHAYAAQPDDQIRTPGFEPTTLDKAGCSLKSEVCGLRPPARPAIALTRRVG